MPSICIVHWTWHTEHSKVTKWFYHLIEVEENWGRATIIGSDKKYSKFLIVLTLVIEIRHTLFTYPSVLDWQIKFAEEKSVCQVTNLLLGSIHFGVHLLHQCLFLGGELKYNSTATAQTNKIFSSAQNKEHFQLYLSARYL